MDSWSEVEARHAIVAGDMANAIKKSASAAKNAGFTFDQLNGIVAAIGATTRQTGKEVGTAMRFIVRRIFSEKGPKELAKLEIPVLTGTGELRKGFDILSDLAGAWKDMTNAQKINIAQAVGGTRQYNALLVLMDKWDEALSAIEHSTNSKGSAERRNLELMKTYEKQVLQVKASADELQISFGKIYLPIAKFSLKGMKALLGIFTAIPVPLKAAGIGATLLVTYLAKGADVIDALSGKFSQLTSMIGDLFSSAKKGLGVGLFEAFGIGGKDPSFAGLKKIGDVGADSMGDFESSIGKTAAAVVGFGRSYNSMLAGMTTGTGKAFEAVGEPLEKFGQKLDDLADYAQTAAIFTPGFFDDLFMAAVQSGAKGAKYTGKAFDYIGETLGKGAESFARNFASENSNLVKSMLPLGVTIAGLVPLISKLSGGFVKSMRSAQDYEKSIYGIRRANESELSSVRNLVSQYGTLQRKFDDIKKSRQPDVKARRQELGTYRSPISAMADLQKEAVKTTNSLADTNLNLVVGYDKLGNAILKTTGILKGYLKELDKIKIKEMAATEVKVLEKYIQDLTKVTGSETWKLELRKLLKEMPIIGETLAKSIRVSPAKALNELREKLNALLAARQKMPLTTSFNKDIEELQKGMQTVRKEFNTTYTDFKRVLANISTEGLSADEIAELFGTEGLRKGFELMIDVEPRFRAVPGTEVEIDASTWRDMTKKIKVPRLQWEDLLGAEVLRRAFPKTAPFLDADALLTGAKIDNAGIKERMGEAFSDDIVTVFDEFAAINDMAGNQAILQLKETTDGVFEWVATYFNTKTLKVEERPFDKAMRNAVDNIFPVQKMMEEIQDRMSTLKE